MQNIRRATVDDCCLIHELAAEAFPHTYQHILTSEQIDYMMHWMYDPENIRKQMEEEGHVYFIISQDGVPAGYVSVRPDGDALFHLEKIYVLPRFQKSHCGGALFAHVKNYVKSLCPHKCAIELNVNRHNPALGFYLHMGMRIDRQGDFPIGNGYYMNDYIMRLEL